MSEFEQIVRVRGAYDKRSHDPAKNYGVAGCSIWFILKGPKGAVQFSIGTNWYVPTAREHLLNFPHVREENDKMSPQGFDLGYHAAEPHYEGQTSMECDLLPSGHCYYDGSTLNAERWVPDFVAGGTDWLWPELERFYHEIFDGDQS